LRDSVVSFTKGFEQNGVIVANLINMQFLFDDPDADDYSLNRYFGLCKKGYTM